jgi:hypothetical protein
MGEPMTTRLNVAALERGLFAPDEAPSAGLEVGDPRLDAVTDAAFKSQYEVAAGLAQEAWSDGVRDIRLIGYLLYGHYLERDVAGLAWTFAQLTDALTTKWDAIGPPHKLKSGDGALNWLFQTLVRQLTGHEKLKDAHYQRWTDEGGTEGFTTAVEAARPLLEAVEARFATGKCLDKLRSLDSWLREQESALRGARERQAYEEAARAAVEAAAAQVAAASAAEGPAAANEAAPARAPNGTINIEVAGPFGLLIRKLKLFEELVTRGDMLRAAVVARDVDQLVAQFDPIRFIPQVFVPFFRLMSQNMEQLEPAMSQLEAPTFRPLVQLYHADLDAFADS